MDNNILKMDNISKEFSNVQVLHNVSISVEKGEVLGIIGENGAGKSTLMKILSGIYQPRKGKIYYLGDKIEINTPQISIKLGISMIHQELNLIKELSVADNIFLGREKIKNNIINKKETTTEAQKYLNMLKTDINPKTKVKYLSIAEKQLVEIAKVISQDVKILIMDEPTSTLTKKEIIALFSLINNLKTTGISILYISHKLEEVKEICDRVVVLRDGDLVANKPVSKLNIHDMANLMVGREINNFYPKINDQHGEVIFEVRNLSLNNVISNINFKVRKGEILCFFGLVGAGRTEMAETIFGIRKKTTGDIYMYGKKIIINKPEGAIRNKIAYLSEDRKEKGLIVEMDSIANTTLITLKNYCTPFIQKEKEKEKTKEHIEKLNIKVLNPYSPLKNLSGGNQQKIAFSKWLEIDPEVFILDEPTRGIDVNAKREIYNIIDNLVAEGKACIFISSELPELIGVCHRIIVMRDGLINGQVKHNDATEQNIMAYATGIGGNN